jgi:Mrp family chromosome partitioning ATPase
LKREDNMTLNALVETPQLDPRSVQDLMAHVDAAFPPGRGRLVGFIASGSREGTSSVAQSYAQGVSTHHRRRVLLLDAGSTAMQPPSGGIGSLVGMLTALAVDRSNARPPLRDGAGSSTFVQGTPEGVSLWELLPRTELWYALRESYDEIVLDLPSAAHSRLGLAVAPYCDGVAVVIEAERTRAPVVESLVSHLRMVRARVLGAVMNRRRFYLPSPIYRLL